MLVRKTAERRAAESTVYQSISTRVCVQHSENVQRIEQRHKKGHLMTGVYKRELSLFLSSNEAVKNSKPDQIIDGFGFGRFLKISTSHSGPALLLHF